MPVGFHFIRALKRPVSSESVQGSVVIAAVVGDAGAFERGLLVVLEVEVGFLISGIEGGGAGEVVFEMRAFFLGGIVRGLGGSSIMKQG